MPNEHLVLCGGAGRPGRGAQISLNLHGTSGNVVLKISDISKRLLANIPPALVDLLEIASYVYAADSAISRGGITDAQMGARWRRNLRFAIPVRLPDLWSSSPVSAALVETLGFLSEDDYKFEFSRFIGPPVNTGYFEFPDSEGAEFRPDEVILFSGGLDSFAGTIEGIVTHRKKVVLVSHRSSTKIVGTQKHLVDQLRLRFGADCLLHVPVWTTLVGRLGKEQTHRTRSFLFVALGTVVARLFDHDRISIFENGLVSLNLPPVAQVVGARATRTTHPQVLAGFGRLFLNVLSRPFEVTNPFLWVTKEEVIKLIVANQCSDLIRDTRSCTRVHDMTVLHSHCGRCSQCIDRRFAVIAAGQESEDPAEAYRTDLFLGERRPGPDREMALAYVRSASAVSRMTDIAFFSHYGETSRVVGFFPESTDTVASRIFDLHQRHAATVCRVFDHTIATHASKLREGTLPTDCLLSLMVSQREGESVYPRTIGGPEQPVSVGPEIRIAIDARRYRVVFEGWGEIGGACAELVIALSEQYLQAAQDEIGLERDLFIKSANLAHKIKCNSEETLRRRILRCRKSISKLAVACGGHPLSVDSVIENSQWHGYRLNPDRVRVIQVSELSGGRVGHASPSEGHASPARRR